MPKALENKLKKQAKKMGLGKKRAGAYVYGTMRKMGMGGGDGMMSQGEMDKMMKEMIKKIMMKARKK